MHSLCFADPRLPQPIGTPYLGRLNVVDAERKRAQLLEYFRASWQLNESLFECIADDDESNWYTRAIPLRHPLVFYYGHNAAFYMNKCLAANLIGPSERIDERIEAELAVGVDEMSWDTKPGAQNYPSVARVREYRRRVLQFMLDLIARVPIRLPVAWDSPLWALVMAMEHERIHVETSSVLIRQLPIGRVRSRPQWPLCPLSRRRRRHVPANRLVAVSGTRVVLGKRDDTFGWDNEYGRDERDVPAFEVARFLVSNAEYLAFVLDDGYADRRWWDDEGWEWREHAAAHQPTFWVGRASGGDDDDDDDAAADQLRLRVLAEEIPMPWDWPVEVNQLEAAAFCRWKSAKCGRRVRLPSESEWYRLREMVGGGGGGGGDDQPEWRTAERTPGNINLAWWASPCPVDLFRQTDDCYDIVGNVWQWTETAIYPFEGFRVHPLYDDYSAPTFDGKHTLMKGGCWISTGNAALKSYRDAFRRHFFQHAGFRYVAPSAQVAVEREEDGVSAPVLLANARGGEADATLSRYLDFQYGPEHLGVPNYARALVELALRHCDGGRRDLALVVGCATGRTTFELARHFAQVIGTDGSGRLVDAASHLLQGEELEYTAVVEGDLVERRCVKLPCGVEDGAIARKIRFVQNDPCNLKPEYRRERYYDLVLADNVLDRVREPRRFLECVAPTVRSGGLLVIACAWTWRETYTSREQWLSNASGQESHEAVSELLRADFDEVVSPPADVPFVVRETARKFQHSIAQVSVWRRR